MEKNNDFINYSKKSKVPAILAVFSGLFFAISLVGFFFLGNFSSNLAYVSYYQEGFLGFAKHHLSCLTEEIVKFPLDFSTGKPFYLFAIIAFVFVALGLFIFNLVSYFYKRRGFAISGAIFSLLSFIPVALLLSGSDVYFGILFQLEPFTTRSLSLTILDILILVAYLLTFVFSILSGIFSIKESNRIYVPDVVEEMLSIEEDPAVDGIYGIREEEILFERIESGETSTYRPEHEPILGYETNRSGPMVSSDSLKENEFVEKVDEIPKKENGEFYEPWEPDGKDEFYESWESDDEEQVPDEFIEECFKEEFEVDVFQEILDLFNSEGEIEDMNKEEFKSMLREVVRDIVRDELARNQGQQQGGYQNQPNYGPAPAYGGPLIVQYFNTPVQGQQAPVMTQQAPVQPQPAPVQQEKKEEQVVPVEETPVEETPVEEPVQEEARVEEPVQEEARVEEVAEEAAEEGGTTNPIIRIPFTTRMKEADGEMQANYNEIKNEIMAYGVKSRVSNSGDTFRLHRVTFVKLTIAGKSLKLYFALNPRDYVDSTIPVQDASNKAIYKEIPLVFKVKSGLSLRRCKQLIADVMEKNGLSQSEVGAEDWVNKLEESSDDED